MRIKKLALALALGVGVSSNVYAAEVWFDTNGAGANPPGTVIGISSMDWAESNILARGGQAAIAAFAQNPNCTTACTFRVYVQARLRQYGDVPNSTTGLNDPNNPNYHEVTQLLAFDQKVTGFVGGNLVQFQAVNLENATMEVYWDDTPDSIHVEGSGFDNGDLILSATGMQAASGNFTITNTTPQTLDQHLDPDEPGNQDPTDNYAPVAPNTAVQQSVTGFGGDEELIFNNIEVDNYFFLDEINQMGVSLSNVSQKIPFNEVNPADCFESNFRGIDPDQMGNLAEQACINDDDSDIMSLRTNHTAAGGLLPVIGLVNGSPTDGGADFIAQSDYTMSLDGVSKVPVPGSLVLLGTGLSALGFFGGTRRRKVS